MAEGALCLGGEGRTVGGKEGKVAGGTEVETETDMAR